MLSVKISLQYWFSSNTVGLFLGSSGSEQSKQIIFSPSVEPTFVNVPQNNFVEPFVLNPGTWTVVIEAEGILLVRQKHTGHLGFSAHRQSGSIPSALSAGLPGSPAQCLL